MGPAGPQGLAGPPGPPQAGTTLVDANSNTIGRLIWQCVVELTSNGVWYFVYTTPAGFSNSYFYYTSKDCSWTPYVPGGNLPETASFIPDGCQYYSGTGSFYYPGNPVTTITINTFSIKGGNCLGITGSSAMVGPAALIGHVGFTPPFSLK